MYTYKSNAARLPAAPKAPPREVLCPYCGGNASGSAKAASHQLPAETLAKLTPTELAVYQELEAHEGYVVASGKLARLAVHNEDADEMSGLKVRISHIRTKLGANIRSVWGFGYVLNPRDLAVANAVGDLHKWRL